MFATNSKSIVDIRSTTPISGK